MRNAFIISSCSKYLPELTANLNSLERIGNKNDVFVIGYKLPEEFTSQFNKLSYKVVLYDVPEAEARQFGGESEILCRKRFWYASEWGQAYDAVCLLDADMWFVRPVDQFFEIASKCGFICGATLEQKRVYGGLEHHKVGGQQLLPEPIWNHKDLCCAPMFFDAKRFGELFKESWTIFSEGFPDTNFKAPDMESYNLLILRDKLSDKVLPFPNNQFVGANEQYLKPYIRVVEQGQDPEPGFKLWSETGSMIYIIHGQFYKGRWRRQQILNRIGCIKGYIGGSEKCENMARGCMDLLYRCFKQALSGPIQIDTTKAYSNNGFPVWTEEMEANVV